MVYGRNLFTSALLQAASMATGRLLRAWRCVPYWRMKVNALEATNQREAHLLLLRTAKIQMFSWRLVSGVCLTALTAGPFCPGGHACICTCALYFEFLGDLQLLQCLHHHNKGPLLLPMQH